jgi:hypothetical protein
MKIKTITACIVCGLLTFTSISDIYAQELQLEVNPAIDTVSVKKFGKNRAHYLGAHMGLGFGIDKGEAGAIRTSLGASNLIFGIRYKRKLNNTFAIGSDLSYKLFTIGLKQDENKTTPDTLINDRQRISANNLSLGGYFRINFNPKRRAYQLGTFIDLGATADWVFFYNEFSRNKLPDGSILETNRFRLNTFNPITYYGTVRVGRNLTSLIMYYRINDWYKGDQNLAEPSRLFIGLQFGF